MRVDFLESLCIGASDWLRNCCTTNEKRRFSLARLSVLSSAVQTNIGGLGQRPQTDETSYSAVRQKQANHQLRVEQPVLPVSDVKITKK